MPQDPTMEFHGWERAAVGFYWRRGGHTVQTITCGDRRFYLVRNHDLPTRIEKPVECATWDDVERVADRRRG